MVLKENEVLKIFLTFLPESMEDAKLAIIYEHADGEKMSAIISLVALSM